MSERDSKGRFIKGSKSSIEEMKIIGRAIKEVKEARNSN